MVQRLLGLRLLMLAVRKNFFLRAPKEPSSTRCNLPVWSSISKRRMGADPDRAPLVRCLSLLVRSDCSLTKREREMDSVKK